MASTPLAGVVLAEAHWLKSSWNQESSGHRWRDRPADKQDRGWWHPILFHLDSYMSSQMVKGVDSASVTRRWEEERRGRGHNDEPCRQFVVGHRSDLDCPGWARRAFAPTKRDSPLLNKCVDKLRKRWWARAYGPPERDATGGWGRGDSNIFKCTRWRRASFGRIQY